MGSIVKSVKERLRTIIVNYVSICFVIFLDYVQLYM